VPVEITGPTGLSEHFTRAVLDSAADDTIFPLDTARQIGAVLRPDTGHRIRWRGQLHPLRFGDVELVLGAGTGARRWPTIVGFSPAPIRYPLLGTGGCLQFMDARFRGADRIVELETNPTFPGTAT
jgi:hypothetical protein